MEWSEISGQEFDELPDPRKPPKGSTEWDPIMAALAAGTPVRIETSDASDQRKKRLSVGRRAALQGYKVQIRYGDGYMAVRKGEDLAEPVRPGRKRRQEVDVSSGSAAVLDEDFDPGRLEEATGAAEAGTRRRGRRGTSAGA